MSKPYDYMVARMLLNIANKSEGLELSTVEHASGEVRSSTCLHWGTSCTHDRTAMSCSVVARERGFQERCRRNCLVMYEAIRFRSAAVVMR